MARWLLRLALVLISAVGAGSVMFGSASAETAAKDLVATCLTCGEQWMYAPSATIGAGVMALLTRRRRRPDTCPKCGSRTVMFGQPHPEPKRD